MPIIDIHIHLSDIDSFHRTAIDLSKVDYSAAGLKAEFDKNDVILGIGMGVTEQTKGAFPDSVPLTRWDLTWKRRFRHSSWNAWASTLMR